MGDSLFRERYCVDSDGRWRQATAKRGHEYRLLEVCMIAIRCDMRKFIASTDDIARAILRSFGIEPVE